MATLTKSQFDELIDRHFQYEAEDDVDGVLSTLVDDLTHDRWAGWRLAQQASGAGVL